MIRKISGIIKSVFEKHYSSRELLVQKRAQILCYLLTIGIFMLPVIIVFYLLFKEFNLLVHGLLVVFVFLFILFLWLTIHGWYRIVSVSFTLLISSFFIMNTLLAGQKEAMEFVSMTIFSDQIYFSMAIIMTALFVSRLQVVLTGFAFVFVSVLTGRNSIPFMDKGIAETAVQLNTDVVVSCVLVTILSFLFLTLFHSIISIINCNNDRIEKQLNELEKVHNVIAHVSSELSVTTEEMAAGTSQFSDNVQMQVKGTDEMTSALHDIVQISESSVVIVVEQQHRTERLIEKVDKLYALVNEMASAMKDAIESKKFLYDHLKFIKGEIDESVNVMTQADLSASKVSAVISIINEVSEQINLLSLNASIEAARAGDHGRGFAVVAEQIGKLADQTTSNSNDISALVRSTGEMIKKTSAALDSINVNSLKVFDFVTSFGSIFDRIGSLTTMDQEMNRQIKMEASDVLAGSQSVEKTISDLNLYIGSISNTIGRIKETISSMAAGSEELVASSEVVSSLANQLNSVVSIREDAAAAKTAT